MTAAANAAKRGIFADIRPLRVSPEFRRLWTGGLLSSVGSAITAFAVSLQVFQLTHSSFAVGAIGLCRLLPLLAFGLIGGSVADTLDRRKLVLVTNSSLCLVAAGLAAQAFADLRQVWLLYLLIVMQATLASVEQPARRTFTPRLLAAELVPAGLALQQVSFQVTLICGPALGGLIAGSAGLRACYLADAVSFAGSLYGISRLPSMAPTATVARPGAKAVGEGLRFIGRHRAVLGAFLGDLNATVLGLPVALFPAINAERFGGSAESLGLLTTAVGVGGVLASALSGPVGRTRRPGRGMLITTTIWGAAITVFGFTDIYPIALLCLAVAGAADTNTVVFRTTIVQLETPDHLRGRVNAADFVVGGGGSQLGNVESGVVASVFSPTVSAISGGIGTMLGAAALRVLLPALAHYERRATSVAAHVPPPAAKPG
jgi:MFS family permease